MATRAANATTLCLVRHGETDWNLSGQLQGRQDIALNQNGRDQARLAGAYLKQWSWDGIVSSPLARASESAAIIARGIDAEAVRFIDDLMEIDVGEASGLTRAEATLRWPNGNIPGYERQG